MLNPGGGGGSGPMGLPPLNPMDGSSMPPMFVPAPAPMDPSGDSGQLSFLTQPSQVPLQGQQQQQQEDYDGIR